ncbi:hypothetical protein D322_376 [Yersinia enterocolitica IP 10393]|nr:hypothetical protein D322_376 [Yersinia enterocolitica IP 10393]
MLLSVSKSINLHQQVVTLPASPYKAHQSQCQPLTIDIAANP